MYLPNQSSTWIPKPLKRLQKWPQQINQPVWYIKLQYTESARTPHTHTHTLSRPFIYGTPHHTTYSTLSSTHSLIFFFLLSFTHTHTRRNLVSCSDVRNIVSIIRSMICICVPLLFIDTAMLYNMFVSTCFTRNNAHLYIYAINIYIYTIFLMSVAIAIEC